MKRFLIFSGFNIRAVIAFIRTLEDKRVHYAIIAKSESDDIFQTIYADKVVAIREYISLDLDDMVAVIKSVQSMFEEDRFIIAPSSEALNRFFLDYRETFKELHCELPLVDKSLYEMVSDKYAFGKVCFKSDITVPLHSDKIDDFVLPFVAKPKKYVSENGKIYSPEIIQTIEALEAFKSRKNLKDFYFQEYIEGRSIYLLYYVDKEQNIYKYSQENLMQQENGKSMLLAKSSSFHNHKISLKFEKLLRNIQFRGLIMIELKLQNDKFFMIEANPRFWGPSQLFVDAGCNLFEIFLYDYGVIGKIENCCLTGGDFIYFWDDGISENFKDRNKVAYYNYDIEKFQSDLSKLKQIEIFNRKDTENLYQG